MLARRAVPGSPHVGGAVTLRAYVIAAGPRLRACVDLSFIARTASPAVPCYGRFLLMGLSKYRGV